MGSSMALPSQPIAEHGIARPEEEEREGEREEDDVEHGGLPKRERLISTSRHKHSIGEGGRSHKRGVNGRVSPVRNQRRLFSTGSFSLRGERADHRDR